MGNDPKYGHVTTQHGTIGADEPVVVFRAQDALLPTLLADYRGLCTVAGSNQGHLDGIERLIGEVEAWQAQNPTKTPDSPAVAQASR
jgi:hypothetical protein